MRVPLNSKGGIAPGVGVGVAREAQVWFGNYTWNGATWVDLEMDKEFGMIKIEFFLSYLIPGVWGDPHLGHLCQNFSPVSLSVK